MNLVEFCLVGKYTLICLPEFIFIERITKPLPGFFNLLIDLILYFSHMLFNKHIGPVPLLGILIVNKGIIECIHMPRSFPCGRVHENRRIDPYHIIIHQDETVPPVFLYVVFKLRTILAVIVNSA